MLIRPFRSFTTQGHGRGKRQLRRDFGKGKDEFRQDDSRARGGRGAGDPEKDAFLDRKTMGNEDFEEYYRTQEVVPPEEWEAFMTCLKSSLPVTFRINGSGKFANDLRDRLESDFFSHFNQGPILVRKRRWCITHP